MEESKDLNKDKIEQNQFNQEAKSTQNEEIKDLNKDKIEHNQFNQETKSSQNEEIIDEKIVNKNAILDDNLNINKESDKSSLNHIDKKTNEKIDVNIQKESSQSDLINKIETPIKSSDQNNLNKINANELNNKNEKIIKSEIEEKTNELNKSLEKNINTKALTDKKTLNQEKNETPKVVKTKTKPVKELPIEKKPFGEFINNYLIPEIKKEFTAKGKVINKITLEETKRPIAEDICWVIYCEINETCNFWLSFEKDDITSLKSFSLCKNYERPSIIESFLIDEKKITLKLIISRILQRLNGQKLIGAN